MRKGTLGTAWWHWIHTGAGSLAEVKALSCSYSTVTTLITSTRRQALQNLNAWALEHGNRQQINVYTCVCVGRVDNVNVRLIWPPGQKNSLGMIESFYLMVGCFMVMCVTQHWQQNYTQGRLCSRTVGTSRCHGWTQGNNLFAGANMHVWSYILECMCINSVLPKHLA